MKKMLFILVLAMLMPFVHAESELNASDPCIQKLYAYSKAQADIVLSVVLDKNFEDGVNVKNMQSFEWMFTKMNSTSPVRACFMRKNENLNQGNVFDYQALYNSSPASLCFNTITLVNDDIFSFPNISKIAEYSATYGVITGIEGMPNVMYLLLMYGNDLPQIVTAFYEAGKDMYISKTSLVYNSTFDLEGSIYLAFPITADNIWNECEKVIWDPQSLD